MSDPLAPGEQARRFFDELWSRGDAWELESSPFERDKYDWLVAMIGDRRYARVLEIGCGAGVFTERLAPMADYVLGLDVSAVAVARAQARGPKPGVEFRTANIMEWDPVANGPWDLVVLNETIYYIGWLYPFFNVAWLGSQLAQATPVGGRLLLANTWRGVRDYLMKPWLIRTYHDLFLNVGYQQEREDIFRGSKEGADLEMLASLFVRRPELP